MPMSNKPKILVDADVLIHLFKAEKVSILTDIFKGRLFMLDIVVDELRGNPTIKSNLDAIFLFSNIKEISFPTTSNEAMFGEFVGLKRQIVGDGERATMLYCKYNQDVIASSNTKDIIPYCKEHSIGYLTTLDILCIAIAKHKITESEADECIRKITRDGKSFLCCPSIKLHMSSHFDTTKYQY
jgi:hypothetical protein